MALGANTAEVRLNICMAQAACKAAFVLNSSAARMAHMAPMYAYIVHAAWAIPHAGFMNLD